MDVQKMRVRPNALPREHCLDVLQNRVVGQQMGTRCVFPSSTASIPSIPPIPVSVLPYAVEDCFGVGCVTSLCLCSQHCPFVRRVQFATDRVRVFAGPTVPTEYLNALGSNCASMCNKSLCYDME